MVDYIYINGAKQKLFCLMFVFYVCWNDLFILADVTVFERIRNIKKQLWFSQD